MSKFNIFIYVFEKAFEEVLVGDKSFLLNPWTIGANISVMFCDCWKWDINKCAFCGTLRLTLEVLIIRRRMYVLQTVFFRNSRVKISAHPPHRSHFTTRSSLDLPWVLQVKNNECAIKFFSHARAQRLTNGPTRIELRIGALGVFTSFWPSRAQGFPRFPPNTNTDAPPNFPARAFPPKAKHSTRSLVPSHVIYTPHVLPKDDVKPLGIRPSTRRTSAGRVWDVSSSLIYSQSADAGRSFEEWAFDVHSRFRRSTACVSVVLRRFEQFREDVTHLQNQQSLCGAWNVCDESESFANCVPARNKYEVVKLNGIL